jgi:hypothetical protein
VYIFFQARVTIFFTHQISLLVLCLINSNSFVVSTFSGLFRGTTFFFCGVCFKFFRNFPLHSQFNLNIYLVFRG